jgi:hypothetical protein
MTNTQAKETIDPKTGILKSLWSRRPDGRWGVTDLKGVYFKPKPGYDDNYFAFESEVTLMTTTPSRNFHEMSASFGTTDFLMKQSVVPVVAWNVGDAAIRCIGTASIISCSGYVLTAAHVIMDPYESGYGASLVQGQMKWNDGFNFGVLIPINPAFGHGERFFPFEGVTAWGKWVESPLFTEKNKFEYLTDIAICKIPGMPDGAAHQPLNMSLNPFVPGEEAYALGYAEMEDVPWSSNGQGAVLTKTPKEIYVSTGKVLRTFPQNHIDKSASTPGPCFDFEARIPGKMSGAPIFGAQGAVIRGVVSRSFSNEHHAFGAMLGPAMHLQLGGQPTGHTLHSLMMSGDEGMAKIQGAGL